MTPSPAAGNAEIYAYIARKPDCGCVTGAVVDDDLMRKETARCVADFVKSGRVIERVTLVEARSLIASCVHKAKQEALL